MKLEAHAITVLPSALGTSLFSDFDLTIGYCRDTGKLLQESAYLKVRECQQIALQVSFALIVSTLIAGMTHFTLLLQGRLFALSLFYRGLKMPMLLHVGKKSSFRNFSLKAT